MHFLHVTIFIAVVVYDLQSTSLGYHGNVVALWERLVRELESTGELLAEMASKAKARFLGMDLF